MAKRATGVAASNVVQVAAFPVKAGFASANVVHGSTVVATDVWTVVADAADDFGDAYSARYAKLTAEASNAQAKANLEYAARRAAAKAAIAALA